MEEIIEYLLNLKEWDKYIDSMPNGFAIMFLDDKQIPDDIILKILAKLDDIPGSRALFKLNNLDISLDDMTSKLKNDIISTGNCDNCIKLEKSRILSSAVRNLIRTEIKACLDIEEEEVTM